jgi:hypothetical protein
VVPHEEEVVEDGDYDPLEVEVEVEEMDDLYGAE